MRDAWTAERIDLLKKLWAEGETATAIAARLGGLSRSAVMGKIFRLRLGAAAAALTSAPRQNRAKQGRSKETAGSRAATEKIFFSLHFAPARRRSSKRDRAAQSAPAASSPFKSLLELRNNSCKWPHGRPGGKRFFFCGKPEADLERGIPYCARHMRRAYVMEAIGDEATEETMA
jgi:GcrA cell cycle regulator